MSARVIGEQVSRPAEISPIFVIGRHRSGTTWLGNVLAALPDVYTPAHEEHHGVHESAFFSQLVPYCNHGRREADRYAVKCLFERSDFFLLTGLERGPEIDGRDCSTYFRLTMEAAARRAGARYWLEKTPAHTLQAKFLSEAFPGAILLAVLRDHDDVVASNVHGFGEPSSLRCWLRQSVATAVYEKIIRRNDPWIIRYEDLLHDYERTVRSLLERLGIDASYMPGSAYRPNSSYQGAAPPRLWWQRLAIDLGRWLIRICPGAVVERAVMWRLRRRAGILPSWFFRMASRAPD